MSQYGKKLLELRQQINNRARLEEKLDQLNKQKVQAEGPLEPLELQLDIAIRKVDRLEKNGIFSLFTSSEKKDMAYSEMSALKAEYFAAKSNLDRINHDIQKVFNRMAAYSDAERLYNTLMSDVNTALENGNTDIIDDDELKQLQKYRALAKIEQLNKAVLCGTDLIKVLDVYIRLTDKQLTSYFREESLKIPLMKFRTALGDLEKATSVNVVTESYKRVPNLSGYDPISRDRYHDRLPLEMCKGMTAKELQENLAELSHNTQNTIKEIQQEIEQLKLLV